MNKVLVAFVVNDEDKLVGFTVTMPAISRAVRKAKGRLFPFGFIPILRSLRRNDTIEALLIGVLPEYQGKGANVFMFKYIHKNCIRLGTKRMLLNPQLEENYKVQSLFGEYNPQPFQRHSASQRRAYLSTRKSQSADGPIGCAEWQGGALREANLPRRAQSMAIQAGAGRFDALCDFRVGPCYPAGSAMRDASPP